ncbi:MAG: hypothetical protein ACRD16_08960 [Thermoanaerobaculia bacterium]
MNARILPRAALAAAFLIGGTALAQGGRASCAFANAAYSGRCVEVVDVPEGETAQQACESILACLNDVKCLKTYCNATEVRSGWKLVSATPAQNEKPR